MGDIKRIADEIFEEMVALRRTLHRHPELGFCEFKTAELICKYLDKLGIPHDEDGNVEIPISSDFISNRIGGMNKPSNSNIIEEEM